MRGISDRAPSQPAGYFEKLAEQEAQRDAQRLQQTLSNKQPEVIDLSDSDNEDSQPSGGQGRMPSPPRLGTLRPNEPPRPGYNQPPSDRPGWPQVPDLPSGGGNFRNANPPPMNRYEQPPNNFRRSRSPPRGPSNVWADSRY